MVDSRAPATTEAQTTIVVSPWQHFSHTKCTLESIYAFTQPPFALVYVDGNSPAHVRRYLHEQSVERGFTLICADRYLTTAEAHNLALPHIRTKYVAFLENNALVTPGWLDALIDCMEATQAWIVGPLYCTGDLVEPIAYSAGPELAIIEEHGERRLYETAPCAGKRLADVRAGLSRGACGYAKSHCMLTRKDVLDRLAPFDEAFTSYQLHRSICLEVQAAGGSIFYDPDAVVVLVSPPPFERGDLPMFLLRWSDAWLRPSIRHFADKWQLSVDDYALQGGTRFRNVERRRLFRGPQRFMEWLLGWRGRLLADKMIDAIFERLIEPTIVARLERDRLRGARPEVAVTPERGSGLDHATVAQGESNG